MLVVGTVNCFLNYNYEIKKVIAAETMTVLLENINGCIVIATAITAKDCINR